MPLTESEKYRIRTLTAHEKSRCEDLVRAFCAELVGKKVEKNGEIEGWHRYWTGLHPGQRSIIENHYQWVNLKIIIRGEEEGAVIARGVASCQHALAVHREIYEPADPESVSRFMDSMGRGLGWSKDDPSTYPPDGLDPNGPGEPEVQ